MIIKEAVYENVQVMQRRCVEPAVHGCDCCGTEFSYDEKQGGVLELQMFHKELDCERLELCSWDCVLTVVPKISNEYFVVLPSLFYDIEGPRSAARFKELINHNH